MTRKIYSVLLGIFLLFPIAAILATTTHAASFSCSAELISSSPINKGEQIEVKLTVTNTDHDPNWAWRYTLDGPFDYMRGGEIGLVSEVIGITELPADLVFNGEHTLEILANNQDFSDPVPDPDIVDCDGSPFTITVTGGRDEPSQDNGLPGLPGIDDPGDIIDTPFGPIPTDPQALASRFVSIAIGMAGGVAFLLMVFGSYRLIFAGGNPESIQQGREIITAAIAGLVVIIFSVFILRLIGVAILGLPI